jgi:predicted ATPase
MLTTLAISNYRSLRNVLIPLQRLNVVIGPNGSGKSNLYRALRLLADTAQGRIVHSLAREGGLPSTVWAGPEVISGCGKARRPIGLPVKLLTIKPLNLCIESATTKPGAVVYVLHVNREKHNNKP